MSIIGDMRQHTDDEAGKFDGSISTLGLSIQFELEPAKKSTNPNAPSHYVMAKGRGARAVQVGSAWLRTANRGPNEGSKFFSITLDDPSMPYALNVAAFRRDQSAIWDITWRRRAAAPAA